MTKKYSEQRLEAAFDVMLLIKGAFNLSMERLVKQVASDFPTVNEWGTLDIGMNIQSNEVVGMGSMMPKGQGGHMITITYHSAQRAPLEHYRPAIQHAVHFPQAQQVLEEHDYYISFSCNSNGRDLASRFKAARAITCVTASALKLLPCTGVLFPSSDIITSPEIWYDSAVTASKNSWPLTGWVSYGKNMHQTAAGTIESSCGSIGVAAFMGCELAFSAAAVDMQTAVRYVMGACYLLLERGNEFVDSDTLASEGGGESIRIRFAPEGMLGAQTDTYVLIHPKSSVNEMDVFGERSRPPAPPGIDNTQRGYEDYMEQILDKNNIKFG